MINKNTAQSIVHVLIGVDLTLLAVFIALCLFYVKRLDKWKNRLGEGKVPGAIRYEFHIGFFFMSWAILNLIGLLSGLMFSIAFSRWLFSISVATSIENTAWLIIYVIYFIKKNLVVKIHV